MSGGGAPAEVSARVETTTVLEPTFGARVRHNRGLLLALAAIVIVAALLAWAASSTRRGYLDPDATDPTGARALRNVITDQGVTVHKATTVREANDALRQLNDATLLVVSAGLRSDPNANQRLGGLLASTPRASTLLIAPDAELLNELAPGVELSDGVPLDVAEPQCPWPVASRAGNALTGGLTYVDSTRSLAAESYTCYPLDGAGSVLVRGRASGQNGITIFGSGNAFTNAHLGENGNAALTMGAIGQHHDVVWFIASRTDPDLLPAVEASVSDLTPQWVGLALAQVMLVVLALAWWRGRVLGPVVTEPLPVVVRAAEATEGRARLYRKISARGHAAQALRMSTMSLLRADLHLPAVADMYVIAHAIEARGSHDTLSVIRLLTHSEPRTDDELVKLADELDELEREVRRS